MSIRNTLIYIIGLLLMGCSDSFEPAGQSVPEGCLELKFSIPEAQIVHTRADKPDSQPERKINNLSVIIYNASGDLLQFENFSGSDLVTDDSNNDYLTKIALTKNPSVKDASGKLKVMVVANTADVVTATSASTVAKFEELAVSGEIENRSAGFVMTGDYELTSGKQNFAEISLNRVAAKMSVGVSLSEQEDSKSFEIAGFSIRNAAESGYISAPVSLKYCDAGTAASSFSPNAQYLYPTDVYNAFVIVKGTYKESSDDAGTECYYRIDLKQNGKGMPVDPNHWYEIEIVKILSKGYASADEAAKYETIDLVADIHDHQPQVLSMMSDGTRELGVTRSVYYTGGSQSGDNFSDCTFTVRFFSHLPSPDYNEELRPTVTVIEGGEWLDYKLLSEQHEENMSPEGDQSSDGEIQTYALGFRPTSKTGRLVGRIKVEWQGLTREVEVVWEREFNPTSICSVELVIHNSDNGQDYTINDYWKFLAEEGTGTDQSGNPKLYGVSKSEMGGEKVRNEGFHFPVMYGNSKWTYKYKIRFSSTIKNNLSDVSVGFSGENGAQVSWQKDSEGVDLVLTKPSDSYDYATGKIIFNFKYEGGKTAAYDFDVYHTGFFHYDNYNHRVNLNGISTPAKAYYYYEVMDINGKHWLDRNLGATSCGYAIIDDNGNSLFPGSEGWPFNEGALGGYYLPAQYEGYANVEEKMFSDLCPPGYRIPTVNEWNSVRNSASFVCRQTTQGNIVYFSSYFQHPDCGKIYFPKGRFIGNDGTYKGEGRAGYYWTASAANGTEKQEIGRWLKAFLVSGSSSSYISGNVENYGMLVRCVDSKADNNSLNVISFNVKGATHVYLYHEENGKKIGLMTWPGKAVGNASTMKDNLFNFVYNSSYPIGELKVIFNFVTDKGRIITMAKSGSDFDSYEGWNCVKAEDYEFWVNEESGTGGANKLPGGA